MASGVCVLCGATEGAHDDGVCSFGFTSHSGSTIREVSAKRIQPASGDRYHVTVDCPMCGKEHKHGNVRDGEMRIASCAVSDVPNHDGYVIRIMQVGGGV